MTKEETIEAIIKAKEAHELQMKKIEDVIHGQEIENPTAVNKTACAFGQWLYDENNHMKEIIGSQFYMALDSEHEKWHGEYARIHSILFAKKQKKGILSKLFKKQSIDPLELDKIKLYYIELQGTTDALLKALASAKRRIAALPETKYSK